MEAYVMYMHYTFLCINCKEKKVSKNASCAVSNVFMPYVKFSFGHGIVLDLHSYKKIFFA